MDLQNKSLKFGDSGCTWALKQFFKATITQAYKRGIITNSTHKFPVGNLSIPVDALLHLVPFL